jgi:hypothetical protein
MQQNHSLNFIATSRKWRTGDLLCGTLLVRKPYEIVSVQFFHFQDTREQQTLPDREVI